MRFARLPLIVLGAAVWFAPAGQAAEVNLKWQQPEEYTDIRANTLARQQMYEQRVIDELGRHIQDAADKYLPPDQKLNMTVTDVDLAGDVDYFFTRFAQGVRVVSNLHFPRIEFTWELVNANGEVIRSGDENVRDMGFQYAGTRSIKRAEFDYEERMIDDWFRETFGDGS